MARKKPPTKKTSSKKKGFLSKINFSSRKTQFMATILVIAVTGAGYFTYQSFAATVLAATRTAGNLYPTYTTGAVGVNDANKNNTPVFKLTKNGDVYANFPTVSAGRTVRYCAMVRADAPVLTLQQTDSVKKHLSELTSAIYETAKWMLVNNHGK